MEPTDHLTNHAEKIPDFSCLCNQLLELTSREWEVLICITGDLNSTEIAKKLSLTKKSVGNYRTRISHKLNLNGVHKLARFARKHATDLRFWYERRCLRLR